MANRPSLAVGINCPNKKRSAASSMNWKWYAWSVIY
jgi:hypothetical protein